MPYDEISRNPLLNLALVITAGIFGGNINILDQAYIPQPESEVTVFAIKFIQSVVFATGAYIAKLAFDYYLRDRIFPKKNKDEDRG